MTEDDLKAVLAKYQQKVFEFLNSNIVLETQVEQLNKKVSNLQLEIDKLTAKNAQIATKKTSRQSEEFS